ncbi:MAG TPA: hypothetical protein VNA68_01330 [Candidatus Dormibacteraeota bacterium]|nr:hypothetical protein [Candidatus Dormibacteraeota bacterium]
MSNSRGRKLRSISGNNYEDQQVFYMSLEEAKDFLADKYEYLAERYERRYPNKKTKLSQG